MNTMAYEKQNFRDGDVLYARQLDHIENYLTEIDANFEQTKHVALRSTNGLIQFMAPKGSSYKIRAVSRNLQSNDILPWSIADNSDTKILTANSNASYPLRLTNKLNNSSYSCLGNTPVFSLTSDTIDLTDDYSMNYEFGCRYSIPDTDTFMNLRGASQSASNPMSASECQLAMKQVVFGVIPIILPAGSDTITNSVLQSCAMSAEQATEVMRRIDLWASKNSINAALKHEIDGYDTGYFFGNACLLNENGDIDQTYFRPTVNQPNTVSSTHATEWMQCPSPTGPSVSCTANFQVVPLRNPSNPSTYLPFVCAGMGFYKENDDFLYFKNQSSSYYDPPSEFKTIQYHMCGSNLAPLLYPSGNVQRPYGEASGEFFSTAQQFGTAKSFVTDYGCLPAGRYIVKATNSSAGIVDINGGSPTIVYSNLPTVQLPTNLICSSSSYETSAPTSVLYQDTNLPIYGLSIDTRNLDFDYGSYPNFIPRIIMSTDHYPCVGSTIFESVGHGLSFTGETNDEDCIVVNNITTIQVRSEAQEIVRDQNDNTQIVQFIEHYPGIEISFLKDLDASLETSWDAISQLTTEVNKLQRYQEQHETLIDRLGQVIDVLEALTSAEISEIIS